VTSERKIESNRENARASTGPKTTQGRSRTARNALRHGLSLPLSSDPALSEEVEALAREIAGADASAEIQEPGSLKRTSICAGCGARAIDSCPTR
jgi:hypothetical protein